MANVQDGVRELFTSGTRAKKPREATRVGRNLQTISGLLLPRVKRMVAERIDQIICTMGHEHRLEANRLLPLICAVVGANGTGSREAASRFAGASRRGLSALSHAIRDVVVEAEADNAAAVWLTLLEKGARIAGFNAPLESWVSRSDLLPTNVESLARDLERAFEPWLLSPDQFRKALAEVRAHEAPPKMFVPQSVRSVLEARGVRLKQRAGSGTRRAVTPN